MTTNTAHRIHIPGIRLHRQTIEPANDRVRALPVIVHQRLAFAQRSIVAKVSKRLTAQNAGARHVTLDRGKFEDSTRPAGSAR